MDLLTAVGIGSLLVFTAWVTGASRWRINPLKLRWLSITYDVALGIALWAALAKALFADDRSWP
ncbi:hypothetical protein NO135_24085, partial [Clostridioides difficile]|nr:hypothetical protein [Clostridioides difficile]